MDIIVGVPYFSRFQLFAGIHFKLNYILGQNLNPSYKFNIIKMNYLTCIFHVVFVIVVCRLTERIYSLKTNKKIFVNRSHKCYRNHLGWQCFRMRHSHPIQTTFPSQLYKIQVYSTGLQNKNGTRREYLTINIFGIAQSPGRYFPSINRARELKSSFNDFILGVYPGQFCRIDPTLDHLSILTFIFDPQ